MNLDPLDIIEEQRVLIKLQQLELRSLKATLRAETDRADLLGKVLKSGRYKPSQATLAPHVTRTV